MNESLVKSLLAIDELQTPIMKILLEKLVDYSSEEDMYLLKYINIYNCSNF